MSYQRLRVIGDLGVKQRLVFKAFKEYEVMFPDKVGGTDSEITRFLGGFDPNIVRPRRNELVKQGFLVCKGKRSCDITGRICLVWGVN
jgi:hypothetical protein